MRLSEIKGEAALDCVGEIIEPIATIASDKTTLELLSSNESTGLKASRVVSHLLKNHRLETIRVLAALSLKTPEEYAAEITLPKLIGDVYQAITDEELLSFLPQEEAGAGTTSGDTREGSEQTS